MYVHSAICETYLVSWYSIDLWPILGGHLILVCTSSEKISSLHNLFGVVVFHTSMVDWRGVKIYSV